MRQGGAGRGCTSGWREGRGSPDVLTTRTGPSPLNSEGRRPGLSKELDGMARCARELELMSVFGLGKVRRLLTKARGGGTL